jgi:hypothetical protein
VSRQRTNRALHALEQQGLLRVEFGGVTVLDLDRLRVYATEPVPPGTPHNRASVLAGSAC